MKIYCAGPLFNDKEKEEMAEIAQALENRGFETFLPQRDGLEFVDCIDRLVENGLASEAASELLSRAIFALDVFQVVRGCDAIVVNLNGRVPDEGAVAEAALAWSAGKTLVAYKSDARSLLKGTDNPLLIGLFGFEITTSVEELSEELAKKLKNSPPPAKAADRRHEVQTCLKYGEKIWTTLQKSGTGSELIEALLENAQALT